MDLKDACIRVDGRFIRSMWRSDATQVEVNRAMSASVTLHEAETQSKLLERVALGEEIISKAGQPVARLGPPLPKKKTRTPGGAEGLVIPEAFFEPLSE